MSHPTRVPPSASHHRTPSADVPAAREEKPWLHGRGADRSRLDGPAYPFDPTPLPRWVRRSLYPLALLSILGQAPALAATLKVDEILPDTRPDGACSLIEALENAGDTETGSVHADCAPGTPDAGVAGSDTIELPVASTHTLTAIHNSDFGPTGLPIIGSVIVIEGRGGTIGRDGAHRFRIFAVSHTGRLTLHDTTVSGGTTAAAPPFDDGGGIANYGGLITLVNSTVSGNSASDAGGGVHNSSGTATLIESTVSGNSGARGGGVANSRGAMRIETATVSDNRASAQGGGIANLKGGALTLSRSTVTRNRATDDGGGVWNLDATATVIDSTVSDNSAGAQGGGGGALNFSGTLSVTNSTVVGNSAGEVGGGVVTVLGTTSLTHTTVSGNHAPDGGGGAFNFGGTVTLSRSLVAGNAASAGAELHNFTGTLYAADFNLLGHDGLSSNAAFHGFTPGGLDRTATSDGDLPTALSAILASAEDHGGPTNTLALVAGSPAIDAVTGSSCPDPTTDQRGVPRPQNGDGDAYADCDIGAFELVRGPCAETTAHEGVGPDGEDPVPEKGVAPRACGSDGPGAVEPDLASDAPDA